MSTQSYGNLSQVDFQSGALFLNGSLIFFNDSQPSNMTTDMTNPRLVAGVVVLLLLVLNLLGNSLVFYVYKFRVKPSVFALYVSVLAAQDIITAVTTMLIDVIVKMRPLDESVLDLTSLCKITHFQVYTQSLISGCVLTLIAYQRYRKICQPLLPSLKMITAKWALVIITVSCLVLASPIMVYTGPKDVQVKMNHRVINVTICRYEKEYEKTLFQISFSLFLVLAFSLVLCLMVVFYVMVAKALKKFERRNSRSRSRRSSPSSPQSDPINKEQPCGKIPVKQRRERYQLRRQSVPSTNSTVDTYEGITTHMYKIFAMITVIFVISYLPHLVVLILTMTLELDYKVLTFSQRLLLDLAYNCPYISCIANPVIYGFRNGEFREHLKRILTCRRRR